MENRKIQSEIERKNFAGFRDASKLDILFLTFLGILAVRYLLYISQMQVPMWDGAVYLINARDWLAGKSLFEIYKPPLISWIIAGVWLFTGENWIYVKPLAALFTIGSGILLYLTLKPRKGDVFALGVAVLTMLNAQVFFYSSQIYTEGLSLFFLVAALYFLKSQRPNYWLLGGVMMGLTFASKYPIFLQCIIIFVVESLILNNRKLITKAIMGAMPVIFIAVSAVYLKTGTFQAALAKDMSFSFILSPFYIVNSINIWGMAFLLVPVGFLFRRTYSESYNYSFIAWFIVSLLFWSSHATNNPPVDGRFAIAFTPAVNYLVFLTIENLAKSKGLVYGPRESSLDFYIKRNKLRKGDEKLVPLASAPSVPVLKYCSACGAAVPNPAAYCDRCGEKQ